jgi:hypothetical protein
MEGAGEPPSRADTTGCAPRLGVAQPCGTTMTGHPAGPIRVRSRCHRKACRGEPCGGAQSRPGRPPLTGEEAAPLATSSGEQITPSEMCSGPLLPELVPAAPPRLQVARRVPDVAQLGGVSEDQGRTTRLRFCGAVAGRIQRLRRTIQADQTVPSCSIMKSLRRQEARDSALIPCSRRLPTAEERQGRESSPARSWSARSATPKTSP